MLVCDKGVPHVGHGTLSVLWFSQIALQWRHNGHNGVSNHQPYDCFLNPLPRRRSRKHQSSASLAFVRGIHRGPVNSPHKWPVTRKMFPLDDVIMVYGILIMCSVFVSKGLIISSVFTCSKSAWKKHCIFTSWYKGHINGYETGKALSCSHWKSRFVMMLICSAVMESEVIMATSGYTNDNIDIMTTLS